MPGRPPASGPARSCRRRSRQPRRRRRRPGGRDGCAARGPPRCVAGVPAGAGWCWSWPDHPGNCGAFGASNGPEAATVAAKPGDRCDPFGSIPAAVVAFAERAAPAGAAATAAVATPAAARSATARGPRSRLVHREPAPPMLAAVEVLDRGVRLLVVVHLDEAEAPAPARLPIAQDLGRNDTTVLLEQLLEVFRSDREAEIPDVKPFCHRTCLEQALHHPPRKGPNQRNPAEPRWVREEHHPPLEAKTRCVPRSQKTYRDTLLDADVVRGGYTERCIVLLSQINRR